MIARAALLILACYALMRYAEMIKPVITYVSNLDFP